MIRRIKGNDMAMISGPCKKDCLCQCVTRSVFRICSIGADSVGAITLSARALKSLIAAHRLTLLVDPHPCQTDAKARPACVYQTTVYIPPRASSQPKDQMLARSG